MKHIFMLCLSLLFALPLWADQMYVGYCNGQVSDNSQQISGTNKSIHCAIKVPAANVASLAGNSITAVRVGVNTACPKLPSSVTAWVRTSADGENLAEKTAAVTVGWNDFELDVPVVIPEGQDLWIGYTYKQTSTKLKVVSFAGEPVEGYSFWYNNGTMSGWNEKALTVDGALSIEAVVTGDNLPQHDLCLKQCALDHNNYKVGMPIKVSGVVRNNAVVTAQGFDIAYSVNGGAVSGVASFDGEVKYREECPFEFTVPTDVLTDGANSLDIELRWKDGSADDYAADNAAAMTFASYTKGYPRHALLEEFTTEQCGWCPMGIAYINEALDTYNLRNDVVWVCHHAGFGTDFLTVNDSQTLTAMYGTGGTFAPAMMVDRTRSELYSTNGVVGGATMEPRYTGDWLSTSVENPAFVSVEVLSATCLDGEIKVRVRAEKTEAFDAMTASPRLNVWITEGHIAMRSQADNAGMKTGYHEHALRRVLTTTWGKEFTWDGNAYEAEFSLTKASGWEADNLHVVAFVSEYSAVSIYKRTVFNATESAVSTTEQGISAVRADAAATTACYLLDGRRAAEGVSGITLRQTLDADGALRTEKVMIRR